MIFGKKEFLFSLFFLIIILFSLFFIYPSSVEAQSTCSQACTTGQVCRSGSCVDVCSDGTAVGQCSIRKPLFCNSDQKLVNNIAQCGCPSYKPVPLPSGYCGISINETAMLADHFEAGRSEKLSILPLKAGLPNLASGSSISLYGFTCPNPIIRLNSQFNSDPYLNGVTRDFRDIYGVNGEKFLIDGNDVPLYIGSGFFPDTEPNENLRNKQYYYPKQGETCYLPNNVTNPYIQLDLGSVKTFSQVVLSFSYPFITDYQILYSNDNGGNKNWKVAYGGSDELSLKNTFTDHWSFSVWGMNLPGTDYAKFLQVHRDIKTRGVVSYQRKIGGVNYQTHNVNHVFTPVTGRYVRFVPKNWYERAGLYEIALYNPDSYLQLNKYWNSTFSQTRYYQNGSYESPIFFANVSPIDLSYQKISWNMGSDKIANKRKIRNNAAQIPEYFFIQSDTGNLNDGYTWGQKRNDLSERSYGYPGNADNGNIGGSPKAGAVPLTLLSEPARYNFSIPPPPATQHARIDDSGIGAKSLYLDGVDDYAWATADPLLRLEDNFTISVWVKAENGGPVLSKGTGNNVDTDYSLAVTTFGTQGQIAFFVRGQLYQTPTNLQINSDWHHVFVTFEKPGVLVFYLNGVEVYRNNTVKGPYARVTYNAPYLEYYSDTITWWNSFLVGAHGRSGITPFKGKIDEIMIYDRALSANEINDIRSAQILKLNSAGNVNYPVGYDKLLIAHWDFSQSLDLNSYASYDYWSADTKTRWDNGKKVPNMVAPQYSQILSGSYPEAGYSNVAYGSPKCAFDDKWAGEPTSSGGSPGIPCVYHPAEAAFHYPYYEGSASWSLDSSNYRLDLAAIFGANTTSDGAIGRALILDGVDDYLSRPAPATGFDGKGEAGHLNIGTGDFSGSVWIKDPEFKDGGILSKGRVYGGWSGDDLLVGAYDLGIDPNSQLENNQVGIRFRFIDSNKVIHGVSAFYSGVHEWHHVAFTLNRASKEMKIYIDGVLSQTYSSNIASTPVGNNYPLVIGAQQFMQEKLPLQLHYAGKIDELRLYGKMLSVSEIQQLANERNTPVQEAVNSGLKGHWKFDESDYIYYPKAISVAHEIVFGILAGSKIDRIEVSELQDRLSKIDFRGFAQLYKEPTGNYNTVSIFELPQSYVPASHSFHRILLYSRIVPGLHERTPLIWEIGLIETADDGSVSDATLSDLNVGFQFRSGDSENEVKSAPWTGRDGTANSFYTSSGEVIHSMHNGNSYFQYRLITSSRSPQHTPVVDNITITYTGKVNQAPKAYIKNPGKIFTFDNKEFDGSLSRDDVFISRYEWDFGDGTVGFGQRVNHQYNSPGEYTVKLKVYDSAGFSGENYYTINVDPFDCMTDDSVGSADTEVFGAITGTNVESMVGDALVEYMERHNLPDITAIDTAEEHMDAALEYLGEHMSYLTPPNRVQCYTNNGGYPARGIMSLDRIKSTTPQCGCPEGADFCGLCTDFSFAYTTLVRAMGVNSKCVYSAITNLGFPFSTGNGHAYNIILYRGKYRLIEPQGDSLTSSFRTNSLDWTNGEIPFYLTGSILNDQVGHFEDYRLTLPANSVNQILLDSKIKNYPGSTGLPDSGRRCIPSGYLNLSTEAKRIDFVAQQMYLLPYGYNSAEYEAAADKCTYAVTFNLRKILGRPPTTNEISRFENCTGTGSGIIWSDYRRYLSESDFRNTFKQSFTFFATQANGDFMAINENVFLEKLYAYLMGFPITDTANIDRERLAKAWHRDTKYSFYRSFYSGYDPLEVFEDVCP
ncbi:MAG: LamG-like jellyroll fold domain-containing protein [Nanoarchaeota archaeon]|nr:LamG-like jellyroll fold domain-containing protein [Nanoarchaeota archaeon]